MVHLSSLKRTLSMAFDRARKGAAGDWALLDHKIFNLSVIPQDAMPPKRVAWGRAFFLENYSCPKWERCAHAVASCKPNKQNALPGMAQDARHFQQKSGYLY
jgi:hypothetical protein